MAIRSASSSGWPGAARTTSRPSTCEVVGVVADVRLEELAEAPRSSVYFAEEQLPSSFLSFVLRTELPASTLAPSLRQLVAAIDPDLPIAELRPLPAVLERELRAARFSASSLSGPGGPRPAAGGDRPLRPGRPAGRPADPRAGPADRPRRHPARGLRRGPARRHRPALWGLLLGAGWRPRRQPLAAQPALRHRRHRAGRLPAGFRGAGIGRPPGLRGAGLAGHPHPADGGAARRVALA